nr:nicotinamide-nucleotide amidohydrolase family protein [Bifidobacterium aemilianum]
MRGQADTLAARIMEYCGKRRLRIAAAESLTGGLLADAFVRIPGASAVFLGSAVTYDIAAKASILHVDADLLSRKGAVDPEVARQMAQGAAALYRQSQYGDRIIGLSTTGVAGPGPDGDKPAGLVYVGVCLPVPVAVSGRLDSGLLEATELRLQGSRESVRLQTVVHLLRTVVQLTGADQE